MTNLSNAAAKFAKVDQGITVSTLANGLRVVTVVRPTPGLASVTVFNKVGARNETPDLNGVSHFLEHMAFKGTTTRSAKEITLEVERLGGHMNAYTSKAATAYLVEGLSEHIEPALDILSDIIKNSTFPADELAREQGVVVEEIHESDDNIARIARNGLEGAAYPNQPLGRRVLGTVDNVRSFTPESLKAYVTQFYHAKHMLVVAVGDVNHKKFVAQAKKYFGDIAKQPETQPEQANYVGGIQIVSDDRFKQAHVYIAAPAPGSLDDNLAKYEVLAGVLAGGMSAPLFQKVREEKGLCYSVGAGLIRYDEQSLFVMKGSASTPNVEEFLKTTIGELQRIAKGEIDENDWVRTLNQSISSIMEANQSPEIIAGSVASQLFVKGSVATLSEQVDNYAKVTKADVIEAAQTLLASVPTLVIAGSAPDIDYTALLTASFPKAADLDTTVVLNNEAEAVADEPKGLWKTLTSRLSLRLKA